MSKIIVLGIVVAVVFGGTYYYLMQNGVSETDTQTNVGNTPTPRVTQSSVSPSDTSDSGAYVEYSEAVLTDASDDRRVLFFYADWCPTCRPADANLMANASQLPDDVTVIRVNYNDSATDASEEALAEEYGITYQHTFVQIDSNGNVVTRWNGGSTNELLANLQ